MPMAVVLPEGEGNRIAWKFAVATFWQGRLHIMSGWYVSRDAADAEYEQLGRSMNFCVLSGRAFIYRHAYRL
jgi:hypothetical protein